LSLGSDQRAATTAVSGWSASGTIFTAILDPNSNSVWAEITSRGQVLSWRSACLCKGDEVRRKARFAQEPPQRNKIADGKDDFAIQHSHSNASSDKPSANDVEAAKKINKPIYVTSRTGLWMVSPGDGKITQVFKSPTWFTDKKSK
jgi:hypothetical protein